MTPRERFRETLLLGSPDKIPLQLGSARESTRAKWIAQGAPAERDPAQAAMETIGVEPESLGQASSPDVSRESYLAYCPQLAHLTGWLRGGAP